MHIQELFMHWWGMIFLALCAVTFIQLFYFLFFFRRLAFYSPHERTVSQTHPVSVIICARDEAANLVKNLRSESIEPEEIDTVILSHGHPDHIGGNLDDEGRQVFPNARYVMRKEEWDYWMSPPDLEELKLGQQFKDSILNAARRNLSAIRNQLDLVDEKNPEILPGIEAVATSGHTPGHMSIDISSDAQRLLFTGDAFIHPLHIEHPETIALVDHQPEKMIATRLQLLEKAAKEKFLVFAPHFPFPGLGHVAKKPNQWEWQPLPVS